MGMFTETTEEAREWHATYTGHGWLGVDICFLCANKNVQTLTREEMILILSLAEKIKQTKKEKHMDPKENLKQLEAEVVTEALEQLAAHVKCMKKIPASKHQLEDIEKAVKLCHQVRSLLVS